MSPKVRCRTPCSARGALILACGGWSCSVRLRDESVVGGRQDGKRHRLHFRPQHGTRRTCGFPDHCARLSLWLCRAEWSNSQVAIACGRRRTARTEEIEPPHGAPRTLGHAGVHGANDVVCGWRAVCVFCDCFEGPLGPAELGFVLVTRRLQRQLLVARSFRMTSSRMTSCASSSHGNSRLSKQKRSQGSSLFFIVLKLCAVWTSYTSLETPAPSLVL